MMHIDLMPNPPKIHECKGHRNWREFLLLLRIQSPINLIQTLSGLKCRVPLKNTFFFNFLFWFRFQFYIDFYNSDLFAIYIFFKFVTSFFALLQFYFYLWFIIFSFFFRNFAFYRNFILNFSCIFYDFMLCKFYHLVAMLRIEVGIVFSKCHWFIRVSVGFVEEIMSNFDLNAFSKSIEKCREVLKKKKMTLSKMSNAKSNFN